VLSRLLVFYWNNWSIFYLQTAKKFCARDQLPDVNNCVLGLSCLCDEQHLEQINVMMIRIFGGLDCFSKFGKQNCATHKRKRHLISKLSMIRPLSRVSVNFPSVEKHQKRASQIFCNPLSKLIIFAKYMGNVSRNRWDSFGRDTPHFAVVLKHCVILYVHCTNLLCTWCLYEKCCWRDKRF
jgi:hypothetical protein